MQTAKILYVCVYSLYRLYMHTYSIFAVCMFQWSIMLDLSLYAVFSEGVYGH